MTGDAFDTLLTSGYPPKPLADLSTDIVARAGNTPEARASIRDLLETYLRHPEWIPEFEHALASADPLHAVSATTARLSANDADTEVREWLNAFHLTLVNANRQQDDDIVLEVLDKLTGF